MNGFNTYTSDMIAFAACVLSLVIALIEGHRSSKSLEIQKQQALDSIRPALMIGFERSDNETGYSGKVYVKNHGLGPAKILSLKCADNYKKIEYQNTTGYATLGTVISQRLLENDTSPKDHPIFRTIWTKEFRNNKDDQDYLAVGEEINLMEFEIKNEKNELGLFDTVFKNLCITMEYTDIHDSQIWSIEKKLSYFQPEWGGEQLLLK